MRRYTAHHQFQYPHGLELLRGLISSHSSRMHSFNALMGLSCYANTQKYTKQSEEFQCPLGLIPHFYFADFVFPEISTQCVNALSGLYLISTIYILAAVVVRILSVSMPSRAYTSFLPYPFKNLGFMRFSEPVFAGIYQNILTTVVFRAC